MNKNIELIAMVYKSAAYLEHIWQELSEFSPLIPLVVNGVTWEVDFKIYLNDPTEELKEYIKIDFNPEQLPGRYKKIRPTNEFISIYRDPKPNDYYLNRVYRCWNYAGFASQADSICFINSDMMFSPGWLENLLKHHDGKNIPCSRLVESGKMLSGKYAISQDFGRHPYWLNRNEWIKYAETIKQDFAPWQGLYMPCIFETQRFRESGGYPEGNIHVGGPGDIHSQWLQSGDDWYFRKLEKDYGMKHITVFDSLCYHIQEGEKSS